MATGYDLIVNGAGDNSNVIDIAGAGRADLMLDGPPAFEAGRTYFVQVSSPDRNPTIYDLSLNLTGDATVAFDLGVRFDVNQRRDVLLGGPGNDRLQGGPSEDWIFGGAGNDVLTGGLDRQNEDLLFGGPGDDLFQIFPDELPTNPSGQTLLTTQSDRFDGGPGFDQVIYEGGDLDRLSQPVPDNVAIRFSRFLQRYEFTGLVWDIANQQWETEQLPVRAIIATADVPPTNGVLSGNAVFTLTVNNGTPVVVTVVRDATNLTLLQLADDINDALDTALLGDAVVAEVTTEGIQLATTAFGANASIALSAGNAVTTNELHFLNSGSTPILGTVNAFHQRFAWYQVLNTEGTRIETRAWKTKLK